MLQMAAAAHTAVGSAAHTAVGAAARTGAQTVTAGSLFVRLVVGLLVVLALLAVVVRVLRRSTGLQARRQAPLAVLARQSLGKGVSVAVVRAGDDTFLLGVAPQHVTRIARMEPDTLGAVEAPPGRSTRGGVRGRAPAVRNPLALVAGAGRRTADARAGGEGIAAGPTSGLRPAPTWRSVVTSLQERTVRRA